MTKQEISELERVYVEQQKIADSILDSVYTKLLEENMTKEIILQIIHDAGINKEGLNGFRYLVGKLLMKNTDDFLEEKYDFQTFYKICTILESLSNYAKLEYIDIIVGAVKTECPSIGAIHTYATNIAVNKIIQENPRFKELFEMLKERASDL